MSAFPHGDNLRWVRLLVEYDGDEVYHAPFGLLSGRGRVYVILKPHPNMYVEDFASDDLTTGKPTA